MRKKNDIVQPRRIGLNPLTERLFKHYLNHPNDSVAGDIVENYHREQFYAWKAKMDKKKSKSD
jgi:hypothetical protein